MDKLRITPYLLCLLLFTSMVSVAQEGNVKKKADLTLTDLEFNVKDDFFKSMEWAYKGSYMQFQQTQNLVFAGLAVLSSLYFIKNDERISKQSIAKHKNEKLFRLVSDSSIFFNTPIMPMIFYAMGVTRNDRKMVRFSQEYLATLTLTLIETAAISAIPVHQRPDQNDLSFWEKAFRGQSSFPSGHVVGYSVLSFKALQFYGGYAAILPLAFAVVTAYERVHSEKHYLSDVVASGFISLLASEGVRFAAGYKNNHPLYQWIFNHNFSIEYIRKDKVPGLLASFTF